MSGNQNLSRKFVFHQIPGFCGNFIFNSHFLISLQAYKLYCFRYRWSGNCFPESESPETDFPRIRNQNKTGFFTGLISSAGVYPVSKKLSAFWLVTIFNQKFMVFLRWPWSIKNGHLWLGQNISVLVLSLNIYRFLFISIKYFFFIKLYFFIILSRGQVHRRPKNLNRLAVRTICVNFFCHLGMCDILWHVTGWWCHCGSIWLTMVNRLAVNYPVNHSKLTKINLGFDSFSSRPEVVHDLIRWPPDLFRHGSPDEMICFWSSNFNFFYRG